MLNKNSESTMSDHILWDTWLGRIHMPALAVADKIGLFNALKDSSLNTQDLANKLNIMPKGVGALATLLVSLGFLQINNNIFSLNEVSKKFLLCESEYYWGHAFNRTQNSDEFKRIYAALIDASGQLSSNGKNISQMWESGKLDFGAAQNFTQVMHSTIHPAADLAIKNNIFLNISHLLDIGGGSGCFSNLFVKTYPNTQATIFELPEVCGVIKEQIQDRRIRIFPGNFFKDDIPLGYDGILFSNILHDWDIDKVKILIDKAYKSAPIKGKIIIHEMLLDEDKCSPTAACTFNLLMYANHGSQQFTEKELFTLLINAGFKNCQSTKTHPYYSLIVAEK